MVGNTTITSTKQTIKKMVYGQEYVYERTLYFDRILKNTKYHYKYVGKEVDGVPKGVRSVLPRRSLVSGPFIPIMRIVRDMGIEDILKLHLTEPETWHILALAISKVVRPLPQASISTWYEGTHLSVLMPASLTSQRNSDLMEKVGLSDLYRKFSHDLVERLHPGDSLLYDITFIPSYSSLDIFEYGHAKDHPDIEQVNLSMVMERSRRIPLYFEMYSGSIPDMVTLRRTKDQVKPMIPGIEIILDRGFFSMNNLKFLGGMRYITAARDNAISAAENRMGRFLLVYMGDYSGSECLSIYRQRDAIEKAFRSLKTDLDIFPLRNHKESTIRGILFVSFISLIIRSALLRGMESSGLLKKYSLERKILELEKIHMMEDQNGNLSELERTKRQRDILEALEGISWW